jgi:hypothetical protein
MSASVDMTNLCIMSSDELIFCTILRKTRINPINSVNQLVFLAENFFLLCLRGPEVLYITKLSVRLYIIIVSSTARNQVVNLTTLRTSFQGNDCHCRQLWGLQFEIRKSHVSHKQLDFYIRCFSV